MMQRHSGDDELDALLFRESIMVHSVPDKKEIQPQSQYRAPNLSAREQEVRVHSRALGGRADPNDGACIDGAAA